MGKIATREEKEERQVSTLEKGDQGREEEKGWNRGWEYMEVGFITAKGR